MSRDSERARDGVRTAPTMAPDAPGDFEPEPHIGARPPAPTRAKLPAIPADPELLRYRHRLDQQLAAWRAAKSEISLAPVTVAQMPRSEWRVPWPWLAPTVACAVAALAGWWLASAPAVRAGEELTQARQALQQEQDKVEKLGAALSAAWRELAARAAASIDKAAHDQERDALQQALQQSEAAAASFAQSLTQERERNRELQQQLAARHAPVQPSTPAPVADAAKDNVPETPADPELLHLMARAGLLLAQGDIAAARIVLERAAETGSASALFALAETFDPGVLAAWGALGTQGDVSRAGELYAKALAAGVAAAKERLAVLRR